tara:strand:+ start:773 stop:4921 length:4149 start_codon:yes stop_codon:yes gene_type:complete
VPGGRKIELISSLRSLKQENWDELTRGRRRLIVATLLMLDAFSGLLNQISSLNLLDYLLGGNLPNDLVWLLQLTQAISCGFFYVKILYDDAKPGLLRSVGVAASPLFLLLVVFISLELLFSGLDSTAMITLDSISIGRDTLTHSSTYLSIAIGLTLTYKVQRYGNFAQSEFFMVGMFVVFVISWNDSYSPLFDAPRDGVLVWSLLFRVTVAAFILTGIAGVMTDLLVYRGFRLRDATPQVMMIASLGVALALRALFYLRFSSLKRQFYPDLDFSDQGMQKWTFPTNKLRIILGDRSLNDSEDANGNGVFDVETYTQQHADQGLVPLGSQIGDVIPGSGEDLDADGRFDANPQKYTHNNCEQSTDPETGELLFDETTGEPVLERIVTEGWSYDNPVSGGSKPAIEFYDVDNLARDPLTNELMPCVVEATNHYVFFKGAVSATIFASAIMLYLLLTKTRLGMRMRAVADNPDLAASSGINVERVQMTSAFLSAGISGAGGAVFAMTVLGNPSTAFTLLLPAFAVIVLGTIGSIPGAIFASIIVGFVRAVSTPILQGVGFPLDRANYASMDAIMPYIFLIAILLVMPQGIGHAWEEWKIERMRKKAEPDLEGTRNSRAALAFLPTGILGLHHWRGGRSDKAQTFSLVAIAAYFFHRFSSFITRQSLAEGGCGRECSQPLDEMRGELAHLQLIIDPSAGEVARMEELNSAIEDYSVTNLEVLTGRDDGTLLVEDSPYFSESPSALDEKWLDLMQTEIQTMNLISDAGDLIWPLIPLLLWAYAIYEGTRILRGDNSDIFDANKDGVVDLDDVRYVLDANKDGVVDLDDVRYAFLPRAGKIRDSFESLLGNIKALLSRLPTYWEGARSRIKPIDTWHSETVLSVNTWVKEQANSYNEWIRGKLSSTSTQLGIGYSPDPYGRRGKSGSNVAFLVLMLILLAFLWWLPITGSDTYNWNKLFQVSNVISTLCIFILMCFSLNLHTGYTGMVNFGVIFFVGIGAIMVGILTAPKEMHGYGWGVFPALVAALAVAAAIGWGLAYPTARLRTDYFAIVTISLGEIVRNLLAAEPLLRTGVIVSGQGIFSYPKPLYGWWYCGDTKTGVEQEFRTPEACRDAMIDSPSMTVSNILNLGEPASYFTLLAIIGLISVFAVWLLLEALMESPWGRILKAIREDEEVAQHHGHDVLTHKAASLALGAAIAAFAGAIWIWRLSGIEGPFMSPAKSTFLVWAAFVIGGTANNRGMVVGAFIIVLMEFVFNVLVAASTPDLPLYTTAERIDSLFAWVITDQWEVTTAFFLLFIIGCIVRSRAVLETGACGTVLFAFTALVMGERSILEATDITGEVSISGGGMAYVKLLLVGLLMLFSLKFNPRGLLPEVPSRPERPTGGEAE